MSGEMQDYFYNLAGDLFDTLECDEVLLLDFSGEDSDFVRLNHNRIRQAGQVGQRSLSLDLIAGARHAQASIELCGHMEQDFKQLSALMVSLREQRAFLPEDPYLNFSSPESVAASNTEYHHDNEVVSSQHALEQITEGAGDTDLVGIFANGIQYAGFASSIGQRNWHSSATFNFDWSCYLAKDKAVKNNYAGFSWQPEVLASKMDSARYQLAILSRPAKTIEPGEYRAYLSPSALNEIIGMMAWGGFGLKSHRTSNTPLMKMVEEGLTLSNDVTLREYHGRGLAPMFTASGFIKPDEVSLIEAGHYHDCLVSARSAKEYNQSVNADYEYPGALDMAAGGLSQDDVLAALGTGLYINNLWYLNFTDRNNCQLTGMTRFACFWVEDGEIVAPVNVMRFDDSVFSLLGDSLIGLTAERELILDSSTYGQRSNHSIELPGALLSSLKLTL
jgi:predicted Zn-dependent protease